MAETERTPGWNGKASRGDTPFYTPAAQLRASHLLLSPPGCTAMDKSTQASESICSGPGLQQEFSGQQLPCPGSQQSASSVQQRRGLATAQVQTPQPSLQPQAGSPQQYASDHDVQEQPCSQSNQQHALSSRAPAEEHGRSDEHAQEHRVPAPSPLPLAGASPSAPPCLAQQQQCSPRKEQDSAQPRQATDSPEVYSSAMTFLPEAEVIRKGVLSVVQQQSSHHVDSESKCSGAPSTPAADREEQGCSVASLAAAAFARQLLCGRALAAWQAYVEIRREKWYARISYSACAICSL